MAEIGASSCRRFLRGEKITLEEFIVKYSDALVRFAYGFVRDAAMAEDVAADSIAIFYMKAKHFPDEQHMRAYLYKIAYSKAMDHLRRRRNDVPLEDVEAVLGSGDPEQDAIQRQRNAAVYRGLLRLPEQYRTVLQLAYLEGFSVKEVCAIMKQSSKQVYNLLARAKASLKAELEKEGITREDL